jgi:hypothetical protein
MKQKALYAPAFVLPKLAYYSNSSIAKFERAQYNSFAFSVHQISAVKCISTGKSVQFQCQGEESIPCSNCLGTY